MSASVRAKRFWEKLIGYYGSGITDRFGQTPPADWCEVIEHTSNEVLRDALSEIRLKHVSFPPNFPEFEKILAKLQRPQNTGPCVQEQLVEFALRNRSLTFNQVRQPWKFLFVGHPGYGGPDSKPSPDYAITGVIIPADGESPSHQIRVEDMQLGKVA